MLKKYHNESLIQRAVNFFFDAATVDVGILRGLIVAINVHSRGTSYTLHIQGAYLQALLRSDILSVCEARVRKDAYVYFLIKIECKSKSMG